MRGAGDERQLYCSAYTDIFWAERSFRPLCHSFFKETEGGADRQGRRAQHPFEKVGYAHHGRYPDHGQCGSYICSICEGLSKNRSGSVPYAGVRADWISG